MLLRTLYYWKKLHDFDRDPPRRVRQTMVQAVLDAASETDVYDSRPATDLEDIPLLSDEALRKMTYAEDTARSSTCFTSSGMTGSIRTTAIDAAGYDWMVAYTLDLYTRLGWRPGQPILKAPQTDENASSWLGRRLMPITAGELVDPEELVRQINTVEPIILESYPRVLVAAVRSDAALTHTPEAVIVTGELLTPRMRQDLEEALGSPILDMYGVAEVGRIAIDMDGSGFELLPAMTMTTLPEGTGHPITTTLVNTRTPIVRYQIPDLVEADGDDTIYRVLGRQHQVIDKDGEPVYPADIVEQVYQHPAVLEFTVHAGDDHDLHIEVVTRDGEDPQDGLEDAMESLGLTVTTTLREGPMPTTEGGKKRAFGRDFGDR